MKHSRTAILARSGAVVAAERGLLQVSIGAQDRLKTMPGYEQYQKMAREIPRAVKSGALSVTWKDGQTFEYARDGKLLSLRRDGEIGDRNRGGGRSGAGGRGGRGGGRRAAGRWTPADSPDDKLKAFYRDRNLWLSDGDGGERVRDHDRRQREGPHQVRHRELGVRRGAGADDRDVVVARQHASSPTTGSTRARCPTTT